MKAQIACEDFRCGKEITTEEALESKDYCGILLCRSCLAKMKFEEDREKDLITFTNWGV